MYKFEKQKFRIKKPFVMPITDTNKKHIAQQRRLFYKICFDCGGKNPILASRCRKCHGKHMRLKNRTLGAKK
ncbi:MAG TPA: 50S ribosomal protein L40e [Nitrososphaeraceae archaeon]|jgi:large subunit ribosomal protein L40e|nr:50S ribosomal protein L40e [Nitrososphaeraceae archaeon]